MKLIKLIQNIHQCEICKDHLPFAPNPVVQLNAAAKLLIIGQAPGMKVQQTGIPWNDASGDRLRTWLQVDRETFYNAERIAIMPMGFCYPGKGKTGDLPPRKECAPQWHDQITTLLPNLKLTLLIGQYAQQYYLARTDFGQAHKTLTERVKHFKQVPKSYVCLPHPSPRNQLWLRKNPWFEEQVIPHLRSKLKGVL